MEVSRIIAEIDAQILKLQQARTLLAGAAAQPVRAGRGRPKGAVTVSVTRSKRKLSPEGRKRIADAMKKRWAERRKQTSSKQTSAKQTSSKQTSAKS
ncbi:hypothetical protein [Edaphobacter aggregans]|uniref:hypothetical protein n=1 Tax=Edaphobacter aggregans TaxID=570835 RepID=UPI00068FFD3E|nr:hypothetical protein [Edaphobacter aggregans]